jgi:peptidoglycan/LPS O-acetylase OafA/YrhL
VRCFVLLATLFIFPVVLYHAVETPMIELGRQWTANLGLPRARYRRLPIPSLSAGGPRSGD